MKKNIATGNDDITAEALQMLATKAEGIKMLTDCLI
jgi:hypothetical protein